MGPCVEPFWGLHWWPRVEPRGAKRARPNLVRVAGWVIIVLSVIYEFGSKMLSWFYDRWKP